MRIAADPRNARPHNRKERWIINVIRIILIVLYAGGACANLILCLTATKWSVGMMRLIDTVAQVGVVYFLWTYRFLP